MASMYDAFRKAGVAIPEASEKGVREAEAQRLLDAEMEGSRRLKSTKEREKRLEILRQETSPKSFRREARRLLLLEPDLVQTVLHIAHDRQMNKKKNQGGTALIAQLYQVRDSIGQAKTQEEKCVVVDKHLPKH